jgi:hypothetical protein
MREAMSIESHPSRKNENAARVGHPRFNVSHPFVKNAKGWGTRRKRMLLEAERRGRAAPAAEATRSGIS